MTDQMDELFDKFMQNTYGGEMKDRAALEECKQDILLLMKCAAEQATGETGGDNDAVRPRAESSLSNREDDRCRANRNRRNPSVRL
jgi:hypothetical protein